MYLDVGILLISQKVIRKDMSVGTYVSMTLVNPDFLKRIFSPESVRVHFRV